MSATTMSQLAGYKGWSVSAMTRPLRAAMRSPWRSFRRRLVQKPGSTLAMTAAAAFAGVIVTNATAMQTERHPSPMFTSLTAEPAAKTEVAAAPLPPARPVAERQKTAEAQPAAAKDTKSRAKDEPQRTASIPLNAKDQMLAIIADSAADKVTVASASAGTTEVPPERIVLIQKALNKAGFGPLKEDGAFGAGTRRALERFEAERKLVVRGEPSGKVLRELSKVAGVAIN